MRATGFSPRSSDGESEVSEVTEAADGNTDNDTRGVMMADGGFEVREYSSDIKHSDDKVRDYHVPSGSYLYAYRVEEGDASHHVVVSRGDEPGTRWEQRIPATVNRPVPGQKRWTIPDNWEVHAYSSRESIAYALYYVPESDVWARVSIPTNDWLTDAWYSVEGVGEFTVEPVGELGNSYDVRRFADEYEQKHDFDDVEEDAEAIRVVARNWDDVERHLRVAIKWVRDEGLDVLQPGDEAIRADADWQIKFRNGPIFRPDEPLEQAIDLSEYDISLSVILEELREAGLLPSNYSFELVLDDSDIDMEYHVRGLIEAGASPAEALDYYMVEIRDLTEAAWAEERGVDQSTVGANVRQAKYELAET
jgi:hypothetical protein